MLSYFSFCLLALLAHRDEIVIRHITFLVQYLCVQTYFDTPIHGKDEITPLVRIIWMIMPITESKEGYICNKKKTKVVWCI
jgi:hypothetical protein